MGDIIVSGGFQVSLDAQFVIVFQLHGSIGVEAFSKIMHSLLQLARTLSLLNHEHLW